MDGRPRDEGEISKTNLPGDESAPGAAKLQENADVGVNTPGARAAGEPVVARHTQVAGSTTDAPVPSAIAASEETFDKWLEKFYTEAGREVTLAYTTLNQMKNWAVLIVGAVLSSVTAVQKLSPSGGVSELPIFVGAVVAYVFTLRFFVRAILCYINLCRWNNLQSSIVRLKIAQPAPKSGSIAKTEQQLKVELLQHIDELYFRWLSPGRLTRGAQLLANLKLGFGLLIALPVFFAISVGVRVIPSSPFALGLTTFAIGYTLVELVDFLQSSYFDTAKAAASRRSDTKSVFPTPSLGPRYLVLSLVNVLASLVVAYWPQINAFLSSSLRCP